MAQVRKSQSLGVPHHGVPQHQCVLLPGLHPYCYNQHAPVRLLPQRQPPGPSQSLERLQFLYFDLLFSIGRLLSGLLVPLPEAAGARLRVVAAPVVGMLTGRQPVCEVLRRLPLAQRRLGINHGTSSSSAMRVTMERSACVRRGHQLGPCLKWQLVHCSHKRSSSCVASSAGPAGPYLQHRLLPALAGGRARGCLRVKLPEGQVDARQAGHGMSLYSLAPGDLHENVGTQLTWNDAAQPPNCPKAFFTCIIQATGCSLPILPQSASGAAACYLVEKHSFDTIAASSAAALFANPAVMLQQPARQDSRLTSWRHSSWQGGHMMTSVLCTRCRSTESMWPIPLLLSGEALLSAPASYTSSQMSNVYIE